MTDNKEQQFKGRCTAEQRKRWEAAARAEKRTFSDWMRLALDEVAERILAESQPKKR